MRLVGGLFWFLGVTPRVGSWVTLGFGCGYGLSACCYVLLLVVVWVVWWIWLHIAWWWFTLLGGGFRFSAEFVLLIVLVVYI